MICNHRVEHPSSWNVLNNNNTKPEDTHKLAKAMHFSKKYIKYGLPKVIKMFTLPKKAIKTIWKWLETPAKNTGYEWIETCPKWVKNSKCLFQMNFKAYSSDFWNSLQIFLTDDFPRRFQSNWSEFSFLSNVAQVQCVPAISINIKNPTFSVLLLSFLYWFWTNFWPFLKHIRTICRRNMDQILALFKAIFSRIFLLHTVDGRLEPSLVVVW